MGNINTNLQATRHIWIAVACPYCQAKPQQPCNGLPTFTGIPHGSRLRAALSREAGHGG